MRDNITGPKLYKGKGRVENSRTGGLSASDPSTFNMRGGGGNNANSRRPQNPAFTASSTSATEDTGSDATTETTETTRGSPSQALNESLIGVLRISKY